MKIGGKKRDVCIELGAREGIDNYGKLFETQDVDRNIKRHTSVIRVSKILRPTSHPDFGTIIIPCVSSVRKQDTWHDYLGYDLLTACSLVLHTLVFFFLYEN